MRVKFKDFYGQFISIHDETASGNVRVEVKTHSDLNVLQGMKEDETTVTTDISLNQKSLRFLIETLTMMLDEDAA